VKNIIVDIDNFKIFQEISCNDNCLDIEGKRKVIVKNYLLLSRD